MYTNESKKIAYILNSFPSIAQTFIIREIFEIKKNLSVTIISLSKRKNKRYPIHQQAKSLVNETHYFPGIVSLKFRDNISSILQNSPGIVSKAWNDGRKTYMRLEKSGTIKSILFFFEILYFSLILKRERIEHIHIHFAEKETTAGLVIADILNISFSFTAHGRDLFLQDRITLTEKAQKAKFIVLGSDYTRNFFLQKTAVKPEKVLKIYAGVDPSDYKFVSCKEKREALRKANNIYKIITVGRLVDEKGYPYILKACRILKERGIRFNYKIIGKGSLKKIVMFKILCKKYRIDNYVEIFGRGLTMEEIKPLYKEADLYVSGSIREVIGVVLMEALSCGIPVAATNITGTPELIKNGENGLLVMPKDEKAIADAMEKLLTDDDLADKLSQAGRNTIINNFDIRETSKVLLNAFSQFP